MTLKLIVINHNKPEKNIKSIIKNLNSLTEKYGNFINVYFVSSKQNENVKSLLEKAKFEIFYTPEDYKKFRKIKFLSEKLKFNNDDFIQIIDADDFIIVDFFPQIISILENSRADIIINSVFKIDPVQYGDKIMKFFWSGVSSNTIYKFKVLKSYLNENTYDEIKSEDNIRHIYACNDAEFIQYIDVPYYLGFRWWEGEVSNSSLLNKSNSLDESWNLLEISKALFFSFKKNPINKTKRVLIDNNSNLDSKKIFLSYIDDSQRIRKEMDLKFQRIIIEHIYSLIENKVNNIFKTMNIIINKHFSTLGISKKNLKKIISNEKRKFKLSNKKHNQKINYLNFRRKNGSVIINFNTKKMELNYE